MDIQFCELCDNYTEADYCQECGEEVCVSCHTAYGCPSEDQATTPQGDTPE